MRTIVITSDRRYWLLSIVQFLLLGFLYRARAYTVQVKGTGLTLCYVHCGSLQTLRPSQVEGARRHQSDFGYSPSLRDNTYVTHTLASIFSTNAVETTQPW
jgi:hypothetical protein